MAIVTKQALIDARTERLKAEEELQEKQNALTKKQQEEAEMEAEVRLLAAQKAIKDRQQAEIAKNKAINAMTPEERLQHQKEIERVESIRLANNVVSLCEAEILTAQKMLQLAEKKLIDAKKELKRVTDGN